MNAKTYLESLYPPNTAAFYIRLWGYFEQYLQQLNIPVKEIDHVLILDYVSQLQSRNLSTSYLNKNIVAIEKVLEGIGLQLNNPVQGFRVKRAGVKPLQEPIKVKELEQILDNWKRSNLVEIRAKVLLSLVHYQALGIKEINVLTINSINLDQAIIEVPSVGKSNSRTLFLVAKQIRLLEQYLSLFPADENDYLIRTKSGKSNRRGLYQRALKRAQKTLPKLKNWEHWRSSIIIHWLSQYSLLEVQERLGHRFASSTERYQLQSLESLQKALKKHHPLED